MVMMKVSNGMIASWVAFFSCSLIVYFLFSDGDFSFLLTYAAMLRCFGFMLLVAKIQRSKSAAGISAKTLQCYIVVFSARLLSIMWHEGYLPYDRSGDWLYHVIEAASLCAASVAAFLVQVKYRLTYEDNNDSFGNVPGFPAELGALCIIVPAVLLAAVFHPSLNKDWLSDTLWTYSMYLESFAILPQLFLFQKQAVSCSTVEMLIGHFVAAVGGARIIEMAFWMSSFHELADRYGKKHVGFIVLGTQIIHLILMADFFYFYLAGLKRGLPMQLPTGSMV
ncbi:ER lumen protein retaining receptor-domain-containing protein [Pelagophyceae sp. CCMP2097]|nr:ER lumen protein retaining receptor-domain-containing protein [Pelagophyceae sp. CCMP2097]